MGEDVHKALRDVAVAEGNLSEAAAEEYIKSLMSKPEGRYISELWS